MKYTKILLILIIISILFTLGCSQKQDTNPDPDKMANALNRALDKAMPEAKYDLNNCEANQDYRDSCYEAKAQKEKNTKYCLKISKPYWVDGCISRLSILEKDSSICDASEESTDTCYYMFARNRDIMDSNACKKIIEEELRITCYAEVARDLDICDQIQTGSISTCKSKVQGEIDVDEMIIKMENK